MTEHRFPTFDHVRKPEIIDIDGIATICVDRTLIAELDVIEPLDERTDDFVSMPIRTVHTAGAGFSVELGPFSLMDEDVVKLYNALREHMRGLPERFKFDGRAS